MTSSQEHADMVDRNRITAFIDNMTIWQLVGKDHQQAYYTTYEIWLKEIRAHFADRVALQVLNLMQAWPGRWQPKVSTNDRTS